MAVSATRLPLPPDSKFGENAIVSWTFTGDDTGDWVSLAEFADRSVQVVYTDGTGTITIEGSNDGVTPATLNDFEGDALTFTTAAIKQVAEATAYIRAKSTGTGGTPNISVILAALRKRF